MSLPYSRSVRERYFEPFNSFTIDDWWDPTFLELVKEEIDAIDDSAYSQCKVVIKDGPLHGLHLENKHSINFERCETTRFCKEMRGRLASREFISWLELNIGIAGLQFDTIGGGIHMIKPGGCLGTHLDFNVNDQGEWRRVNVLIYLNKCGLDGELELVWSTGRTARCITPKMNRMVVFECSETSWHGHPRPLQGTVDRKSIAAYYFTTTAPADAQPPHSTKWMALTLPSKTAVGLWPPT